MLTRRFDFCGKAHGDDAKRDDGRRKLKKSLQTLPLVFHTHGPLVGGTPDSIEPSSTSAWRPGVDLADCIKRWMK